MYAPPCPSGSISSRKRWTDGAISRSPRRPRGVVSAASLTRRRVRLGTAPIRFSAGFARESVHDHDVGRALGDLRALDVADEVQAGATRPGQLLVNADQVRRALARLLAVGGE